MATHRKVAPLGAVSFYERKEKKGKKLTKSKYRSIESFKAPHFSLFFALSSWEGGKRRREGDSRGADPYDCRFSEVVCAILLDEMARFPLELVLVLGLVLSVIAPAMAQQAPAPSPQSDGEFMDLVICFISGVRSGNNASTVQHNFFQFEHCACQIYSTCASKLLSNLLFSKFWYKVMDYTTKVLPALHKIHKFRAPNLTIIW